MTTDKQNILKNLCYTDLVYDRINKKLNTSHTRKQIEEFILGVLKETDESFYSKTGKNYYITNTENKIRITINSNTFRVITADKVSD